MQNSKHSDLSTIWVYCISLHAYPSIGADSISSYFIPPFSFCPLPLIPAARQNGEGNWITTHTRKGEDDDEKKKKPFAGSNRRHNSPILFRLPHRLFFFCCQAPIHHGWKRMCLEKPSFQRSLPHDFFGQSRSKRHMTRRAYTRCRKRMNCIILTHTAWRVHHFIKSNLLQHKLQDVMFLPNRQASQFGHDKLLLCAPHLRKKWQALIWYLYVSWRGRIRMVEVLLVGQMSIFG